MDEKKKLKFFSLLSRWFPQVLSPFQIFYLFYSTSTYNFKIHKISTINILSIKVQWIFRVSFFPQVFLGFVKRRFNFLNNFSPTLALIFFFFFPERIFRITSWHLKCYTFISKLNGKPCFLYPSQRSEKTWTWLTSSY